MPLSITATYNSINKDTAFGNGPASGYGWQFSFNQYVREVTDKNLTKAGYNYIYTDADGTDHYLKLAEGETAKWEDEDGLGITLTKDEITSSLITVQQHKLTNQPQMAANSSLKR